MLKHTRFALYSLAALSSLGLLSALAATAQDAVPGADGGEPVINVFQPAPSDIRKPLMRAEKAIQEERDADAAYELGVLLANESLDDAEQQDYFIFDAENAASVGDKCLKAEANRMIAELSPAGRKAYELQFGAQARALLDDALTSGNWDELSDVIRRFLHTEAGLEASMLAGRLELGRGRPMAAALHFQRIIHSNQAAQRFDPELSILLATCWMYAHMPEKAEQTLVGLKRRTPGADIRVGNQDEPLFGQDAEALAWLEKLIGHRPSMLADQAIEWTVFRGNGQRNARVQGSEPMMNFRWRVPTPMLQNDPKIIDAIYEQYRDEGLAAIPVVQPLAVDDTILMRTPDKLLGVDFTSGKRVWVWPPWDDDESSRRLAGESVMGQGSIVDAREREVHQRVWEDAAHGQLSSDGKSVFLLHELGFANIVNAGVNAVVIMRGMRMNSPYASKSYNELVSLSLARQGAADWIVGGATGEDEPKLAGAFFLGAPLPLGGRLYVLAEFLGEIRLVVLNAESGKLLWQQQLAHVDARTVANDGLRRLSGASPSFQGGVLLCPTSAGALVAIDISTRSLLWGYQYRKIPKEIHNRGMAFMQVYQQPAPRVGKRWADATVTVADGRVLLTAVETGDLHCLDLLSGKPAWPSQPREDRLYVACVHDGKAVFVGANAVSAIRMSDGQAAWDEPVAMNDPPSGRGFYTGHDYYLPTSGAELLQIDLDKGQVVATSSTTTVLGNLVCYRDQVISQSPHWLTASYQSDPLLAHVEKALSTDPSDVEALGRFGEIQRQEGKIQEAIATLRKALELAPENETTRSLLVDTMIAAIKEDFEANRQFAPDVAQLMDRPTQRREYLRVMARGWHEAGDLTSAFEAYVQLADLNAEMRQASGVSLDKAEQIERYWDARVDRWLQGRVAELLSVADDAQRTQMAEIIHRRYEATLEAEEAETLRRFLAYFGASASADDVRLRLARRLIDMGDLLEAELLLGRLYDNSAGDFQSVTTAALARLFDKSRQYDLALDCYQDLLDQWPDASCREGQTGRELYEEAVVRHDLQQALKNRDPWPLGDVEVSERTERINRFPSYRRVVPITIRQQSGLAPSGLGVSLNQRENSISISNNQGKILMNISMGQQRPSYGSPGLARAHLNGHLLVVFVGSEILAIDLLQAMQSPSEAVLWRKKFSHITAGTLVRQPQVKSVELKHPWGGSRHRYIDAQKMPIASIGPVLDSGVYFMNHRELVCVHPLTGDIVWTRENLPQGADVFGDHQRIFVIAPDSAKAFVFNAVDGAALGERELEPLENRWSTCGAKVLAWEQNPQDGTLSLRLYDAWSGEDVWREQFSPAAKGTLVDCDEVAVMAADGRLLIRSLKDDSISVDAQLEREEQLASLHVLRSKDQYLVAANRVYSAEPNTPEAQIRSIISGTAPRLITGNLYAVDRKTGSLIWEKPTPVKLFGFLESQPVESPVAVFLRHVMPKGSQSSTGQHTSVLCIDRRSGRKVLQKDDIPAQTYTYEIQANRVDQTVTISLPQRTLELRLTDEPIREKPVEQEEAKSDGEDDATAEPVSEEEEKAVPVPAIRPNPFGGQMPAGLADPFGGQPR